MRLEHIRSGSLLYLRTHRGFSGYNTKLIQADLEANLLALPATGAAGDDVKAVSDYSDCNDPLLSLSHTAVCLLVCMQVTVMLGSNDCVQKPDPLHVSIDDYKANLHAIVANLRQRYPAAVLFLLTPPPCDGEAFKKW